MTRFQRLTHHLTVLTRTLSTLMIDGLQYFLLCLRPSPALAAENLFLRKQLTLYQERDIKPRRATPATCIALIWLARWFDWRRALVIKCLCSQSAKLYP
jgi:putative transposase